MANRDRNDVTDVAWMLVTCALLGLVGAAIVIAAAYWTAMGVNL